jgi:hypothetical protein
VIRSTSEYRHDIEIEVSESDPNLTQKAEMKKKLTHSRCDVCSMIVPSPDLESHSLTHFKKCPTCNQMIFESAFKDHLDSHMNLTQKTETKRDTLTKKRIITNRGEYRHDRAAEVF